MNMTKGDADPSVWTRDPNGFYHLKETSSPNNSQIEYKFSTGNVTSLPSSSKPSVSIDQNGDEVQFDFGFPLVAGKNSYQIALDDGFTGTETEWLQSLRGPQGIQGIQGPIGKTGDAGQRGPQGEQGPIGKTGDVGPQGEQGPAGESLTNRGKWVSGTVYHKDDYVFAQSSTSTNNALYILLSESDYTSTLEPKNDLSNWIEIAAPQGPIGKTGDVGPQGEQGEIGPKGDKGDVGPQGEQGPSAPTINSVTISITRN